MSLPKIATRDEWLAARKELLAKEKELTRQRDALNIERRNLPMVEIEKDYVFDGPERRRSRLARPVRGPAAADHLPLHVRPGVGGRLPELHGGHRRAVARLPRAPAHPRHHLRHGVAGAAGEARAVEGEAGLGHPLVLVVRHRLQLRLRRHDRRVGRARASTTSAPRPSSRRWARTSSTSTSRSRCPAGAASCRSTGACSTPTRSTPAASSRPAARTTSSTSPPSAARRTGRSRRAAATRSGRQPARLRLVSHGTSP